MFIPSKIFDFLYFWFIEICRYAVYLIDSDINDRWTFLLGMNRVCVNAKKTMLIAMANPESPNEFKYIELKRWIAESNRE